MFFGKLFGSSFRFRCRDLGLPGLLAASVFAVPAHHLPPVFESEHELSMSRGSVQRGVCVEKKNSIQKVCLVGFEPPTCCVFRDVDALLGGFQARLLKGFCLS